MSRFNVALTTLALCGTALAGPLKVANGTVEQPHASPWQAKLYVASAGLEIWPCGGTLISANYVLTAARCLTFQRTKVTPIIIYVYLGIWDIEKANEKGSMIYKTSVLNVTVHENYNASSHENDVALVRLPMAVSFSDTIQPAKLASKRHVKVGDEARISGWQYPQREWDLYHQYLHAGKVTVVETAVCQSTYPEYVIDAESICASGSVAFCYGDEGIALPVNGEVVGIAYAAKEVGNPSEECPVLPQAYLSVAKYLDWIKANSDYIVEDN